MTGEYLQTLTLRVSHAAIGWLVWYWAKYSLREIGRQT